MNLSVAQIVECTEAEGPGRRFALWFQGCPLRCPGCCNPQMLAFDGGESQPLAEVAARLSQAHRQHQLEGVTLLGGEPFAHALQAAALAQAAHNLGLNVMVFSGYSLEALQASDDRATSVLLGETDILVDGPYHREQPETVRRWIGSANQRVYFLTDRASPADPRWQLPNTLEIRLVDGVVTLNGFPARHAQSLWRL